MPGDRDAAVAKLSEILGSGLTEFVRSPEFAKFVEPLRWTGTPTTPVDATLYIEGASEPTDLPQLRRIIDNASKAAGKLYQYADQQRLKKAGKGGATPEIRHRAAMRYAATSRDSLATMVKLLGGEVEDGTFVRTLDEMIVEDQTEVAASVPLSDEAVQVKLADIYTWAKQIKHSAQRIVGPASEHNVAQITEKAQQIMDECKDG